MKIVYTKSMRYYVLWTEPFDGTFCQNSYDTEDEAKEMAKKLKSLGYSYSVIKGQQIPL